MKNFLLVVSLFFGVSAFADSSCNLEVYKAKQMIAADGVVDDSAAFAEATKKALLQCKADASGRNSIEAFILLGQQNCDDNSSQMSDMWKGYCYLKVAESADWILQ